MQCRSCPVCKNQREELDGPGIPMEAKTTCSACNSTGVQIKNDAGEWVAYEKSGWDVNMSMVSVGLLIAVILILIFFM